VADLEAERRDGVVWVTLNRPERKNAVTSAMWDALTDIFLEFEDSRDDRVLVLTGAGDSFCGGADLNDPVVSDAGMGGVSLEPLKLISRCALALHELTKPTIAAVNGVAVGAGFNLALGCDLVIAADRARFSQIFVQRGLAVDFGGTWLLPRIVGLQKAKELAMLGEIIDAQTADRLGAVTRVVPTDELLDVVEGIATRLAALPPLAVSLTKQMLNASGSKSMSEALDTESLSQTLLIKSLDTREAVAAFLEKRPGKYVGR
jgi:2-(1,2-epoxy-1,2-dihydrophenyl)acetyl-CoA isomerase